MEHISGQLYKYLQSVQAYVSPPVAAVFLLGLCWKRLNAKGAMSALLGGFVLGALRLILELNKEKLADGSLFHAYATMNFLHFAIVLFAICSALLIAVSLITRPMPDDKLKNLTFQSVGDVPAEIEARVTVNAALLTKHIVVTVLLVVAVLAIWWYFSPWGIAE
jgi:SSS family solute:Na+ symporter